ncbi:hypothetical protein E1162_13510 [Rhodobacteraceae bacterium RKSG542]|uniref:phasin family protein n=1 Tax=Pseudovibrio flavus TaxID=2529854 RepID=UPI0012BCAB47|nr:phasin family protein [Pseudovibrio flavus]MTI18258.1 hypothetical protein [Pseudovibrio flavus]
MKDSMKAMTESWSKMASSMPWQDWFLAQNIDRMESDSLDQMVDLHTTMLSYGQNLIDSSMQFFHQRMEENARFARDMWDCPTAVEMARIASDYVQTATEQVQHHNIKQFEALSKSMDGSVEKSKKATATAMNAIDELKAFAESAATSEAPPRRRSVKKTASSKPAAAKAQSRKPAKAKPASAKAASAKPAASAATSKSTKPAPAKTKSAAAAPKKPAARATRPAATRPAAAQPKAQAIPQQAAKASAKPANAATKPASAAAKPASAPTAKAP